MSHGVSKIFAVAVMLVFASAADAQDTGRGQRSFRLYCAQCHDVVQGEERGAGPNLFGIVGKPAGSQPGFGYTDALKNRGISWTEENMDIWLENPKRFVPGTREPFGGVKNAQSRADIVAYLKTLKAAETGD